MYQGATNYRGVFFIIYENRKREKEEAQMEDKMFQLAMRNKKKKKKSHG